MRPTSLSATSLNTADGCMARYKAEVIDRGRGAQGDAAVVGLLCHETLEHLLRGVFIRRDMTWNKATLEAVFNAAYEKLVGADRTRPEYGEAYGLVLKWFSADGRLEYFNSVQIVSLEVKNNFPLPVMIPDASGKPTKITVPVNYIMDRVDRIGPNEYRIVDYKTNWVPVTHDQLRRKIQARLYALALQIIHPDAERIWVEFDLLRHEAVGIVLTKDDQAETWRMLKRAAQTIFDTDDKDAEKQETINSECGWCVRLSTCKAVARNVAVGGILSLDAEAKAKRYAEVVNQAKALELLKGELQDELLKELMKAQTIDLDLATARIRLKRSSRRSANAAKVAEILGPELAAEVGTFTMGVLDALRKTRRINADQIARLEEVIEVKLGDPTVDVTIK